MRKRQLFIWGLLGMLLLAGVSRERAVFADGPAEIQTEIKYVALTFDDGPKEGTTDMLLDGLKARGASATFFLLGEQVLNYPDLVRRMADEGHQIGNHTWSHARLEGITIAETLEEVGKTEALLEEILGGGDYWLRPPYGQLTPGAEARIQVPMVKWSVDPRDWESRNAEKIVQAVLASVQPNSIILLHDIYPASVEAALRIVDVLQAEDYWFVTVEELLRLNGVEPQKGVLYRTGKGP